MEMALNQTAMRNVSSQDTPDDHSAEPSPEHRAFVAVFLTLVFYVYPSLALLGVCANGVSLAVWTAEANFNPTTFFIRCLACVDILLLLVKFSIYLLYKSQQESVAQHILRLDVLLDYLTILTVHSTLAVVFTRWLCVYKPQGSWLLQSRKRVAVGYLLTVLWSAVVGLPSALVESGVFPDLYEGGREKDKHAVFPITLAVRAVSLVLPVLVLVVLNTSIIYMVCRHRIRAKFVSTTPQQSSRFYRLVAAVLCLSFTTFFTYPVAFAGFVFHEQIIHSYGEKCYYVVILVVDLLVVLNSSVNLVYYLAFASQFRQLCRYRFSQCCQLLPRCPASRA